LVLESSLAQEAISNTREISGRIKSHLVLTLDSQSTRVLAHIQSEKKTSVPTNVQKEGSRRLNCKNSDWSCAREWLVSCTLLVGR
jgi:hypothetical protein